WLAWVIMSGPVSAQVFSHMPPGPSPALYLASASPRRRELLAQLGLAVLTLPQDMDESQAAGEVAETYVARMALEKVQSALRDPGYVQDLPLLAADTVVVCDGMIL